MTVPCGEPVDREGAFQREAIPFLDDVARYARSLTRDEADADDLVQDTYFRAYRSWHTYAEGSECRRWLFTICRNSFLRSRERARLLAEFEGREHDSMTVDLPRAGRSARDDDALTHLDLAPAIARAIRRLPRPFRAALVLIDVQDQSYATAASILGVPTGTVRSRLFRARRLMQGQLGAFAHDAGIVQDTGPASPPAGPHGWP